MTAKRPTVGTSIGSTMALAPSSFALAQMASVSSTPTYGVHMAGMFSFWFCISPAWPWPVPPTRSKIR